MVGLFLSVGLIGGLSKVRTAIATPFSFTPSRQTKGAAKAPTFPGSKGLLAQILFKAANPIEAYRTPSIAGQ